MNIVNVIDSTGENNEKLERASKNLTEWEVVFKQYPENTRRAYMADMEDYKIFCDRFGYNYITTDFEVAKKAYMEYVDELVGSHLKRATIERRLATLSVLYQIVELPNPAKVSKHVSDYVRLRLRNKPKAQKQAKPLRIEDLEYINDNFKINKLKDLRDLMVLNFAFSALLRGSELCAIEHGHIDVNKSTLFIPVRKNDQDGEGGFSFLSDKCIELYKRWKIESETYTGMVFRAVNKGNNVLDKGISYRTQYDVFKDVILRCGMDPTGYSTHSGRVGAVSSMAEAGMDGFEIQLSGGWNDPKMPARYAKQAQMKRAGIAKLMGNR